jgi:hypothetical protein
MFRMTVLAAVLTFNLVAGEAPEPKDLTKADAATLKTLLDALGNESYDEREKATAELVKLGPAAIDAILAREKETADLEIRTRCAKLRDAIGDPNATALAVLAKIEKSDAIFVRPGASRIKIGKHYFTGPEFAKHLRTKAAVNNFTLTHSASEFVDMIASESSLHQAPYTVSLADGTVIELKIWLADNLKLKSQKADGGK